VNPASGRLTSRRHARLFARKDYDDRRRRQAQGQAKAKAEGRYKGRVEDVARNAGIASMLKGGLSWTAIQSATGCSRATIAKIAKRSPSVVVGTPQ
jgi:DNA invertase Pin-like site-specific DNA recombinase